MQTVMDNQESEGRMKIRVLIILLTILSFVESIKSQHFAYSALCDSSYLQYKNSEPNLSKIFRKTTRRRYFSKDLRAEIKEALRREDYQKLESIIYQILHGNWCKGTSKFAQDLAALNIINVNGWILTQSTKNYITIDYSKMTSLCYEESRIPITESQELLIDEIDEVWLAHRALLLNQIVGEEILAKITKLKESENVFARFTFAQIMHFWDKNYNSLVVLEQIIFEEIRSLKNEVPTSQNYVYTVWSLELLKRINRSLSHKYCAEIEVLYKRALKFYEGIENKDDEQLNNEYSLQHTYKILNRESKSCP